jgi:hypothetical protein
MNSLGIGDWEVGSGGDVEKITSSLQDGTPVVWPGVEECRRECK